MTRSRLPLCTFSLGVRVALVPLIIVASACGGARYMRAQQEPAVGQLPTASISRNVVVVSVDGLRPDAIGAYDAPTLQRLMRDGSYTLSASTIHPSALDELVGLAENAYGPGNFSLIVTADHGGHDRDHGSSDPQDVTIPWIAWGKGVKQGTLAASTIRTMDTASTVLWLLGLAAPSDWAGQPVTRAYESAAVLTVEENDEPSRNRKLPELFR